MSIFLSLILTIVSVLMLQLIVTAQALSLNSLVILTTYGVKQTIPTDVLMAFPHLLAITPYQQRLMFRAVQLKILTNVPYATQKQGIFLYLESINVFLVQVLLAPQDKSP